MPKKNDVVNHPTHYTQGEVECIEAIKSSMSEESFRGYLKGNAIKYIWRYEKKANKEEDLAKAIWYIKRLLSEVSEVENMWGGELNG